MLDVRVVSIELILRVLTHVLLLHSLHTAHTTHYTLHTAHCTLHTTHYTLHTTHYTIHTTHADLRDEVLDEGVVAVELILRVLAHVLLFRLRERMY